MANGRPATILVSISDNKIVQHCLIELTQPAVWLTGLHLLTVSDLASEQHSIWFLLLVLKRIRKYPDAHALELVSSACDLLGHGSSAYQRCTNGP